MLEHNEKLAPTMSPRRISSFAGTLFCLFSCSMLRAQVPASVNELVTAMLSHESYEAAHRKHYIYLSNERSDRTRGHLWTERVVETTAGKIRMLVAEDGQAINGDRLLAERARLADIATHPDLFQRQEQTRVNDEVRAKEMLELLPKAFLFQGAHKEGRFVRIDFRPNPAYFPRSIEERVMHEMSGSMLIEQQQARLHELTGRLPIDVNIGFGLLATIHAGSSFSTLRNPVPGDEWKTATIDTNISGRAIFFKSIGKVAHTVHSDFKQIPINTTVAQAVEMIEK
jgi:hypothetical protein